MRVEIPRKIEIICDACGVHVSENKHKELMKRNGKISIYQDTLNSMGEPVCDGSKHYDLCDKCLDLISVAVATEINSIKGGGI
jgi:hypothetical protein